jgi:hypothetical protein
MGLKRSAVSAKISEFDSSDLHYNNQDWSSAKATPENIERKIKLEKHVLWNYTVLYV